MVEFSCEVLKSIGLLEKNEIVILFLEGKSEVIVNVLLKNEFSLEKRVEFFECIIVDMVVKIMSLG